jgi:hypothetical protein
VAALAGAAGGLVVNGSLAPSRINAAVDAPNVGGFLANAAEMAALPVGAAVAAVLLARTRGRPAVVRAANVAAQGALGVAAGAVSGLALGEFVANAANSG